MNEAGLLLASIQSYINEIENQLIIDCVDSLRYPLADFALKILFQGKNLTKFRKGLKLFVAIGNIEVLKVLNQDWEKNIKQLYTTVDSKDTLANYELLISESIEKYKHYPSSKLLFWLYCKELLSNKKILFPRGTIIKIDDLSIMVYFGTRDPQEVYIDLVNDMLNIWLQWELPHIKGYQCLTQSFIVQNLIGRRALGYLPDHNAGQWTIVFEGGLLLPLDSQEQALNISKINSSQLGKWTVSDVEEITRNPIYAYGYLFEHLDLFLEWQYVLFYALTVFNWSTDLSIEKLDSIYIDFLQFFSDNICLYKKVDKIIIDKTLYLKAIQRHLKDIKSYLIGFEEIGISKNVIYLMRTRYAFLPKINELLSHHILKQMERTQIVKEFNHCKWGNLLKDVATITVPFEKGFIFEELANYFFECIAGLKVTGRRKRGEREEVDLYCCNVSLDPILWKMGPIILVECKNLKRKFPVSEIRNLIPIMDAKGLKTAIIFGALGFSPEAIKEIKHENRYGKIIIPITITDLQKINSKLLPYEFLKEKIIQIEKEFNQDDNFMY